MTIKHLAVFAVALMAASNASAQTIKQIPLPLSQNPTNADRPIAGAVWAGNTLYVSGWLDPDLKTHKDAKSQMVGILEDLRKFLKTQNLALGDVVMMHVYIAGDPATDGKANLAGTRAVYPLFFGTKDQPNKPANTALLVALPSGARGALVEIDLIAVRSK